MWILWYPKEEKLIISFIESFSLYVDKENFKVAHYVLCRLICSYLFLDLICSYLFHHLICSYLFHYLICCYLFHDLMCCSQSQSVADDLCPLPPRSARVQGSPSDALVMRTNWWKTASPLVPPAQRMSHVT